MSYDFSRLHDISDEFLMFLAHGSRTLTSKTTIENTDENIYITLSDIGASLTQLPINIFFSGLCDEYSKNKFKEKLKENIKSDDRFKKNQVLLNGIFYNGFFQNLLEIGLSKKNIKKEDLPIIKCEDINIDFTDLSKIIFNNLIINNNTPNITDTTYENVKQFADISSSSFFNGDIKNYYERIINFFEINQYLKKKIKPDDLLMFGETPNFVNTALCILCFYKIIIMLICQMMKNLDPSLICDGTFFGILSQLFIKDCLITPNTSDIDIYSVLSNFNDIFKQNFIEKNHIVLKIYYKTKEIPNYNYQINGYFTNNSSNITKVGLYKVTDFYNFVKNSIFNSKLSDDLKNMKKIKKLEEKDIKSKYPPILGKEKIDYYSISNNNEALKYIEDNYNFMIEKSLYPNFIVPRDLEPIVFTNSSGDARLVFTKGIIRNLKQLISDKIFGNNNIVFLLSCASTNESNIWNLRIARQKSINNQLKYFKQNDNYYYKYLTYKKKYLCLKKQLNL
jgi:hypothetical protein